MPALKDDLMALERKYWEGMKRKDGDTAAKLTGADCIVIGQEGVSSFKPRQVAEMTRSAPYDLEEYAIDANTVQVMSLSDDVAVVAYGVRERMKRDGRSETLNAFDSSVWVRKNGEWQCAVHTETPAAAAGQAGMRR